MPNKDKKDVEEYSRPSYEPGSKAQADRAKTFDEYYKPESQPGKTYNNKSWKKAQAKMAYQNSYIAKGEKASNSARYEAKLRALKKIGKDGRSEFEKRDMIDFSKKADGSSRLYK
jgi:hypothetical protein